jgi:hypothetical protein
MGLELTLLDVEQPEIMFNLFHFCVSFSAFIIFDLFLTCYLTRQVS